MAVESEVAAAAAMPSPVQSKDGDVAPGQAQSAAEPARPLKKAVFAALSEIEPDAAGYNLKVKVVEAKTVVDRQRPDGTRYVIGEAVVADQSACCTLTLRGPAQMEVAQPGANLVLRNAKTVVFEEHIRLTIDQFGLLKTDPNPVEGLELNMENDLSKVAYELVQD